MHRLLLSAVLLSTFAGPAIGQVTLQLGTQQQVDPRDQPGDTRGDQERDRQRDAQRDEVRDAQRDYQRDGERDRQRDDQRRAERQSNGDTYDSQRNRQIDRDRDNALRYKHARVYGYNGRNERRDWRYDGTPYRVNAYVYPRGGSYRERGAGDYVSWAYRGPQRYWIGNPATYRLSRALTGTRWIRIGQDALMVRVSDGIVASAVYGVFY